MDTRLKESEWIILQALWQESPLDLKGIIASVRTQNADVGWDYKTYHSFAHPARKRLDHGRAAEEQQPLQSRHHAGRSALLRGGEPDLAAKLLWLGF